MFLAPHIIHDVYTDHVIIFAKDTLLSPFDDHTHFALYIEIHHVMVNIGPTKAKMLRKLMLGAPVTYNLMLTQYPIARLAYKI